jgi:uncharacterized membrane protein (DUF2068 family)
VTGGLANAPPGRSAAAPAPRAAPARDLGTNLIVTYKGVKALVELALLLGIVALARGGEHGTARALARSVREHLASGWSVAVSHAVRLLASQRGMHLLELGLSADALLTGLEGWSLWKGYRWSAWLVVCVTLIPIPWELWEIGRRGSWARVAIAAANLAVVGYLAWRIARSDRAGEHDAATPRDLEP